MRHLLRENGLSLTMFGLFAIFLLAQSVTGFQVYNDDRVARGASAVAFSTYLQQGHFVEATFENWESEFLQIGVYVVFTAFLFQRGSSESKNPDGSEPVEADPALAQDRPGVPWPVRQGGIILHLYDYSLTLALLGLFLISFTLHAVGGAREYSEQQLAQGGQAVSTLQFLQTAEFWFQSFQNWQSEFLAMATLAVLTIVLRQKGSPESKPVAAPHHQTGIG